MKTKTRVLSSVFLFLFLLTGLITLLPTVDQLDGINDIGGTVDAAALATGCKIKESVASSLSSSGYAAVTTSYKKLNMTDGTMNNYCPGGGSTSSQWAVWELSGTTTISIYLDLGEFKRITSTHLCSCEYNTEEATAHETIIKKFHQRKSILRRYREQLAY